MIFVRFRPVYLAMCLDISASSSSSASLSTSAMLTRFALTYVGASCPSKIYLNCCFGSMRRYHTFCVFSDFQSIIRLAVHVIELSNISVNTFIFSQQLINAPEHLSTAIRPFSTHLRLSYNLQHFSELSNFCSTLERPNIFWTSATFGKHYFFPQCITTNTIYILHFFQIREHPLRKQHPNTFFPAWIGKQTQYALCTFA